MNRLAKFSAVLGIASLSALGAANAAMMSDSVADHVRTLSPDQFSVVTLSSLKSQNSDAGTYDYYVADNAEEAAKIVAVINENKPLMAALEAQNVQINNIAGVQQAADGSVTFVVK